MQFITQCKAITKKGLRCRNSTTANSDYCFIHSGEHQHNLIDSTITLSKADILSIANWRDDGDLRRFPRLTPIGLRTLTRKDVKIAVEKWREHNGSPQLPVYHWWQRKGSWHQGPNLAGLNFSERDLNGMDLDGIILSYTNLHKVSLRDSSMVGAWLLRADMSEATCTFADLSNANFLEANLADTEFWGAKLCGAFFTGTELERTRFLGADLSGAFFNKARLSNTEMTAEQLGGCIGEEKVKKYSEAAEAYTLLKANFESLGRYSDAGWAYRKQRRMQKKWANEQAKETWKVGQRKKSVIHRLKWGSDWIVELLCDYGESIWHVIAWILAILFVIGPTLIWVLGGLTWTGSNKEVYFSLPTNWQRLLYGYFQGIFYMLDVFTTADFSELAPRNDAVRITSGLLAMFGVFLVGLLGFVAGNRIRNS